MNNAIIHHISNILQLEYDITLENIQLTPPPKADMWDICFACFPLSKVLRKSPSVIAQELSDILESEKYSIGEIQKTQVDGWYLNIFLDTNVFAGWLEDFLSKDIYSDIKSKNEEVIYIDYIWANVWKPLHIGHMCTPVQWQTIINLFRKRGYKVIADSHIGDWGIIFWKLITGFLKYWSEEKLEENAVEHLFQIYVQISNDAESDTQLDQEFRNTFKKLSSWDDEMKQIWEKFTKKSIQAMDVLLTKLQVFPDYNIGESFYEWLWLAKMEDYPDLKFPMHSIVEELVSLWIATQNEDWSVWVIFPEESKLPSCILQKRDGTHGYLASDLASIKYRMDNWNPKKIIYFVDVRQKLHFEQVFFISKMASWVNENTEMTHAYNGFIALKDWAMSTRKGKIIKLEALLWEGENRAAKIISQKRPDMDLQKLKELSQTVSIGAIKYGYLKKTRESDSIFDWDEYMSFEWNSGPYIQYAYVRAQKILTANSDKIHFSNLLFENACEHQLVSHILKFQDIIQEVSKSYHPHKLCNYVYEWTKLFSSVYANVQILSETDMKLRNSRLALLTAFCQVIEEIFDILWISLPSEM